MLKRVSHIKGPNLTRSGGMVAASPKSGRGEVLSITDEQPFPHPAEHRLRNAKCRKRRPSLKRVSQNKKPNLTRSGGWGRQPPGSGGGEALPITDEQLFPHPAKHRLRNAKCRKRRPSLKRVSQNKKPESNKKRGYGGGSPRNPGVGKSSRYQINDHSRTLRSIDSGMQSAEKGGLR